MRIFTSQQKLHPTQHIYSCLQRQTSTLILLIETRIKITENHFSSDFMSGSFLFIISFIPHRGCLSAHELSAYVTHKKERVKVTLGHSQERSTQLGIHLGKHILGNGEEPKVVYPYR